MSCGNPHDTDCSDVLDRIYAYLDGELDEDLCGDIRKHLDECGPCLAKYDLERTVKTLVARSCHERAPESLRARVPLSIREVHVSIRREGPDSPSSGLA